MPDIDHPPAASDLTSDLADILRQVRRPGDFHASGTFDLVGPGIEVEGVGPLALPVLPEQAARLVAAAERAPFGRGRATVVDMGVRRSWQIAPGRVRIGGRRWPETLRAIVERAARGLGVEDPVAAEFYKLLVYEAGDFFLSHRDTEKSPGMFATLLIGLPSHSTGGDLLVRHAGREARIDLRAADPGEARFAAFYADCPHEVLPVEAGCRVTLVYNLIRTGLGRDPEPPRYEEEETRLAALLDEWRTEADAEQGPEPSKLVYPLAHAYTPAEVSFASLKGADAAAAGVLATAAARADCDLHLALLTIEESGSADYVEFSSGHGRWRGPQEDEYEIGEIFETTRHLSAWRRLDDGPCPFGDMPVRASEFSPPDVFEDMAPDEQHLHEATGNEGASLERTYRRAALVLWPKGDIATMLASAGLGTSLPVLADLAGRCRAARGGERGRLLDEAMGLARAIAAHWPDERRYWKDGQTTPTTTFLDLLVDLGDRPTIAAFLLRRGGGDTRGVADMRAVVAALSVLDAEQRGPLVAHLIEDGGPGGAAAGVELLARAARAWRQTTVEAAVDLVPAARGLIDLVLRAREGGAAIHPHHRLRQGGVTALLTALCLIDPALADRAVAMALADFDMDGWLIPSLRDLLADPDLAGTRAIEALRLACAAHLDARIALPLAPPADFRRASALPCTCPSCADLARFLDDPVRPSWVLKALQSLRIHVENTISKADCDVTAQTIRKGSPHQLLVTKTQASYDRLARQRRDDIAILSAITPA